MWLQALVEIVGAPACNKDSDKEKEDGYGSENSQCLCGGCIVLFSLFARVVDADEFEYKVREGTEIEENGDNHANKVFPLCAPGCEEEENDGYRDGSESDPELHFLCAGVGRNDDEELD